MSYNYDTLEQALEQAAYRLPVSMLGTLINRAEEVITVNADSAELEREINSMVYTSTHERRLFDTRTLVAGNDDFSQKTQTA